MSDFQSANPGSIPGGRICFFIAKKAFKKVHVYIRDQARQPAAKRIRVGPQTGSHKRFRYLPEKDRAPKRLRVTPRSFSCLHCTELQHERLKGSKRV